MQFACGEPWIPARRKQARVIVRERRRLPLQMQARVDDDVNDDPRLADIDQFLMVHRSPFSLRLFRGDDMQWPTLLAAPAGIYIVEAEVRAPLRAPRAPAAVSRAARAVARFKPAILVHHLSQCTEGTAAQCLP